MASRDCKFRSFFECYGHFPLKNRFGVDQVPLELNRRDFTLDLQGTTDPIHIRGPKKDLDKRQATIQVCVRNKGEKNVKPTLIFRNANPTENRYGMPSGLRNRRFNLKVVLTVCSNVNLKLRSMRAKSLRRKRKSCRKSSERTQHPGPDMALKSFQRGGQDRKSPALTMTRP